MTIKQFKSPGSGLVERVKREICRLADRLEYLAEQEQKNVDARALLDGVGQRKIEFDIMHNEFEEWGKTHEAFECVQASDFKEVWMTAYRAGMKAQRIAQIKADILSPVIDDLKKVSAELIKNATPDLEVYGIEIELPKAEDHE